MFSVALNSLPTTLYWQANDHSVSLFIEATSKKMSLKYLATREFSATVSTPEGLRMSQVSYILPISSSEVTYKIVTSSGVRGNYKLFSPHDF